MKDMLAWDSHTFVMGIINLTPDSFSGDGLAASGDIAARAVKQAGQMIADGAQILDLGAESSRPGADPINAEEELKRLLPALLAIRKAEKNIILSVDTYKSAVAEQALAAGADWINDIWGLRYDKLMAGVIHQHSAGVIIMHNGRKLENKEGELKDEKPRDTVQWVKKGFAESLAIAKQAGIDDKDIILDVGIGFGKTVEQNLELINRLDEFKSLGYPLLVGPSRKSFIGATLDLPADQRLEGTAASVAISIDRGVDIIRVHDVLEMTRVARMCDSILAHRQS
jgi:dihydropteroate synthase